MSSKSPLKHAILDYFARHYVGCAKEVYITFNRMFPYKSICDTLEELVEEERLERRVVPGTKFMKPHYAYVYCREPFYKKLFRNFLIS